MSILGLALSVQEQQTAQYFRNIGQTENDLGEDIPTFEDAIPLNGSFQPVDQNLYRQNGFDLDKRYFTFFTEIKLNVVDRDTSGDKIIVDTREYQVLQEDDWFFYDNFVGVTCVKQ